MNFVIQAEIKSKKMIQDDVCEITVVSPRIRPYTPGSFVQLSLSIVNASERWPISRTFSIASYSRKYMRFIIKNQGEYTNQIINSTKIGQKITIKYPFGEMYTKSNEDKRHIFIAGGLGITPFFSLIEYFKEKNLDNYYLFYSVKRENQIIDKTYLEKNVKNLYIFTTQEKSKYISRRINMDDILELNFDKNDHFYICGSKDFINFYRNNLERNNFDNIHMDEWE